MLIHRHNRLTVLGREQRHGEDGALDERRMGRRTIRGRRGSSPPTTVGRQARASAASRRGTRVDSQDPSTQSTPIPTDIAEAAITSPVRWAVDRVFVDAHLEVQAATGDRDLDPRRGISSTVRRGHDQSGARSFLAGSEDRQSQAIQHHVIGLTGDRRHRERLSTGPHRGPRRKRGEAAVDARRVAERVEEIGVPDEGEVGLARALHPLDDLEGRCVMFVDLDHSTVDAAEGVATIGQHADRVWDPTPPILRCRDRPDRSRYRW